ncbi:MAG: 4-hydroxy-tetrahydrodipicolinate synthase [Defluviitaleaceae bacterium]|nr:4-hydroxy-tetrahydrodipicolinate synthase [Defluviitaleaceae bacterium]
MAIFTGSGTALCTPFDEKNEFNYEAYEKLIKFQLDSGTDAIVSCGTTGETSTLYTDEHIEVVRAAAEITKKHMGGRRVPVIAGAGGNDTRHCVELGRECVRAGADACMYVTPYYNKTTQRGLVEHFTKVASQVDAPIILYNIQVRTGMNMEPKTFAELSKIDSIVAVKEASGNIVQVAEIAELCGERIDIYSGNDDYVLPILSLGGRGVISTAANIIPGEMHELVQKFMDGDVEGSRRMQLGILALVRAIFAEVNPMPIKAALNLLGFGVGPCRMPLTSVEDNTLYELKRRMAEYGLKVG